MSQFVPGHCQDIDGAYWHEPGECPGAIVNCNGLCCSKPKPAPRLSDEYRARARSGSLRGAPLRLGPEDAWVEGDEPDAEGSDG